MAVLVKCLLCKQEPLSLRQTKEAAATRVIHRVCWSLVGMSQVSPVRPFETSVTRSVIIYLR